MKKHLIPFADTGYFSNLILDYLSQKSDVKEFYGNYPTLDGFKKQIEDRTKLPVNRQLLVAVIEEQCEHISLSAKTTKNLQKLRIDNAFTVTTGHQLNLFTGPLYFIYKIISTINLAEILNKEFPDNHFVPVYWMHAEDHDFKEINHIHLFGKKIEWEGDHQIPAGYLKTKELESVLDDLGDILGNSDNAAQLKALLRKAYLENDNLADATRFLANELFKDYGLLILDANDKRLKQEFIPYLKAEILEQENADLVNETNKKLESKGYKTQVNPREINCFYMDEGCRSRIVQDEDVFKVLDSDMQFTKAEMEQLIEEKPYHFSPNVVLRPMYQECILPNIAYVGGAGELAYWLQYKSMFEKNEVSFPVLVLRNSVMVINKNLSSKLEKTGLTIELLFQDTDLLINQYVQENASEEISLEEEKGEISKTYQSLKAKAENVDPTLGPRVEAELANQIKSIEKLEDKLRKAEKAKFETSINQIRGIKDKLFPERSLQERYENFTSQYLQHGSSFISEVKEQLEPLDSRFIVLVE